MTLPAPTIDTFPHNWTADVLRTPPLIAPARQFTYPQQVPGEEDTLARGAVLVNVKPASAPNFLATCALGFTNPRLPSGVFSTPNPASLLALAGGYAYLIDTTAPETCLHLPIRPVEQLVAVPDSGLILLAGFHEILALGATGVRWQTARLSWEGLTLNRIADNHLHGTGWHMPSNRDLPFTVDLNTGHHTGGGVTA
ncbi:MAG: hypothetical protein V4555_15745 [Acidobacteriota bacterium]